MDTYVCMISILLSARCRSNCTAQSREIRPLKHRIIATSHYEASLFRSIDTI